MTPTEAHPAPNLPHRRNALAVALVLALAVLASGSAVAWLAWRSASDEAERQARAQLRTELASRKGDVIGYLESVGRSLENIASSRISRTIVQELVEAIEADGEDAYADIRRAYLLDNPNPEGHRQALLSARDGSRYSAVHALYHDWLLRLATTHDYHDLFLTDAAGNIVYSVFKEDDFGTSLISGEYRGTELAHTFHRVRTDLDPERSTFSDFVEYAPSGNLPAAFVGSPILADGEFAGALLAQLRQSRLDELLGGERDGGAGIEVYVVGEDGMLRAGSGVPETSVLRIPFDAPDAAAALTNRSGMIDTLGFRGEEVLSAHAPLRWSGVVWGIVAEMERARIERPLVELRRTLVLAVLLGAVLAFAVGWLLAERDGGERAAPREAL